MKYWFIILLSFVCLIGCKKQSETLALDDISTLYPMQVGRVFIYRMDSTRISNYAFSTVYYLAKDSVVNTFVDNQGRTCYSVLRSLTDTLASQPYQHNETYYVAYDKNKIETVDGNNRRFINLVNPVSYNTTWSGNSYLDTSVNPIYSQVIITDNTSYLGWTYQYTAINQPYAVIDSTFPNTFTVQQIADSSGTFDPNNISFKTYTVEVYAKGVGLVYKEFMDYFFQPPAPPLAGYYEDGSFGLKLNLVSYR